MSVNVRVLFGRPQAELASLLSQRLATSIATSIVTGFATEDGMSSIAKPLAARPNSVAAIIVGAGTHGAYQALDGLLNVGIPVDRLFVHLGFTKPRPGANKFVKYHPMLHSKVYYTEQPNGLAAAFVGSHNITSFALTGKNGEASVLIEGPRDEQPFAVIRQHIEEARAQAVPYSPGMKPAYAWWLMEWADGLRLEVKKDIPTGSDSVRTLVVFAEEPLSPRFTLGDVVYFEIPHGIQQLESTRTPAHLFLFDKLPSTPYRALQLAPTLARGFTCRTRGLNDAVGEVFLADWAINDNRNPVLARVPGGRHAVSRNSDKQQVLVEATELGVDALEYLFSPDKSEWYPDYEAPVGPRSHATASFAESKSPAAELMGQPAIGDGWRLVYGLRSTKEHMSERESLALEQVSPESGSYIMVSLGRRKPT